MYKEYAPLEKAFADKQIHPADLKDAVTAAINKVSGITLLPYLRVSQCHLLSSQLLAPIRKRFESPKLVELTQNAYPAAPAKVC